MAALGRRGKEGRAQLESLRTLNKEMRACSVRADVRPMIELNRQFHFRIFSLSPNKLILEEVRRLWSMPEPSMWSKFDRREDRDKTLAEHDRLVAALAAHDRRRCAAEMENHRYAGESGLPLELPGAVPDEPLPGGGVALAHREEAGE